MYINCSLKNKSNFFSTKKKDKTLYWSGRYFCANKDCNLVFRASFEKWPLNDECLSCKIHWEGVCQHEKIILPKTECRGKDRELISFELMAKGTDNYFAENLLKDLTQDECNYIEIYFSILLVFFIL